MSEIDRMLGNAQTKVIMPVLAYGVLRKHSLERISVFSDSDVKRAYEDAISLLKARLKHDFHIGAKYEDAYGMRMSRYGFFRARGHLKYELSPTYAKHSDQLCVWIPERIVRHIESRVGIIPLLEKETERLSLASDPSAFLKLVAEQLAVNPANFEIVSFALIKVHLEKFACRIYRDTRTAAHDQGVDLATNFGVVYQVKKLRILSQTQGEKLYKSLKVDFGNDRLQDGNVILIIDDIAEDVRRYLVNMRVQSIKKDQLLSIARGFEDCEDRQKVLRVIYNEFRRDYSGSL